MADEHAAAEQETDFTTLLEELRESVKDLSEPAAGLPLSDEAEITSADVLVHSVASHISSLLAAAGLPAGDPDALEENIRRRQRELAQGDAEEKSAVEEQSAVEESAVAPEHAA